MPETKDMYFEKELSFSESEESDYTGYFQSKYQSISFEDVQLEYLKKEFPSGGFPKTSVSLGCIGYRGPNGSQIDFYIFSPSEAERYYDYNQRTQSIDESLQDKGVIETMKVSNREAVSFYANNTDISGLANSKRVFVPLPGYEVFMVYIRNFDYNDEVTQGFQHILDSLSIQNPLP